MFAYTNADVATLNQIPRALHKERGDLGEDHALKTSTGEQQFATSDRIQFPGKPCAEVNRPRNVGVRRLADADNVLLAENFGLEFRLLSGIAATSALYRAAISFSVSL